MLFYDDTISSEYFVYQEGSFACYVIMEVREFVII